MMLRTANLLVLLCCCIASTSAQPTKYEPLTTAKPQVVGGKPLPFVDAPWAVVLYYTTLPNPVDAVFCGGVFLNSQWVMTAAHCVNKYEPTSGKCLPVSLNSFRVGYGSTDIGKRMSIIVTTKMVPHDAYDCQANHNDIALLELVEPVSGTSPIRLPTDAETAESLRDGFLVKVSGWGATNEHGWNSRELLEVEVPVVSLDTCIKSHAGASIPTNALCAGRQGKDSCTGDSGGPMYVGKGKGAVVLGVVSMGDGCGKANRPGVYTPVLPYKSWIAKIMAPTPCEPSTKPPFIC